MASAVGLVAHGAAGWLRSSHLRDTGPVLYRMSYGGRELQMLRIWCWREGSNLRPSSYEDAALPLCYASNMSRQAGDAPPIEAVLNDGKRRRPILDVHDVKQRDLTRGPWHRHVGTAVQTNP